MVHVKFEYKDKYTHGKWNSQECTLSSVEECVKLYGLDQPDVSYRIVSVDNIEEGERQR